MKEKQKTYTVAQLRQSGNKVRVIQLRYKANEKGQDGNPSLQLHPLKSKFNPNGLSGSERSQRGGLIRVEITLKDGKDYAGEAACHIKDQFNRRIGLTIALNRALNGVEVS